MKQEPGIAFLGSSFAQRAQAPAFEAIGGVRLVGASSPNSSEQFAKAFDMPVHTPDWKALVQRDDVDLVCITSPPKLHCEQALFTLSCGKHVLCEKPFAMSMQEAEAMSKLARETGRLAIIDHELRFSPGMRHFRKLIREGKLGRIFFTSISSHIMYRRDPMRQYDWWSDKQQGGGAWGAIGSHLIDQLHYHIGEIRECKLLQNTVIKERPDKDNYYHQVTSDDISAAAVQFKSGCTAQILVCMAAAQNRFDLEVTGEYGALRIDMDHNVYFTEPGGEYKKLDVPMTARQKELEELYAGSTRITARSMFSRSFIHYADAIIDALKEGRTSIEDAATFDDGVKVTKVMGW